jgi:hypothetical protein
MASTDDPSSALNRGTPARIPFFRIPPIEEMAMLRTMLLLPLALAPLGALADDCRFTAERVLDMDAAGLATLKLDTGAGDLDVVGVPGLTRIEVRGKACASEEAALAGIQLSQQSEGTTARVATTIPDDGFTWELFGNHYAYMDVRVRMPAALALELRDSSGDLDVAGITAGLDLTDSSGDIELRDLGGVLHLADSSGDIEARGVDGSITIASDSSGDIDLVDVKGDAIVERDSSGDIDFRRIEGRARVGSDSSGDIGFDTIGGDAEVGDDGSGEIVADHVRGNFTVARKAAADNVRHSDIGGKLSLPPSD